MAFWFQNTNCINQSDGRRKHRPSVREKKNIEVLQDKVQRNLRPSFHFGKNRRPSAAAGRAVSKSPIGTEANKYNVPVNKIDLFDSSTKSSKKKRLSRSGSGSNFGKSRDESSDSQYDSDFSVNTGGFDLGNCKEITEEEFTQTQSEWMRIIQIKDDNKSHLEFKKLFSSIKQYCMS